jgi:hypothetical protein
MCGRTNAGEEAESGGATDAAPRRTSPSCCSSSSKSVHAPLERNGRERATRRPRPGRRRKPTAPRVPRLSALTRRRARDAQFWGPCWHLLRWGKAREAPARGERTMTAKHRALPRVAFEGSFHRISRKPLPGVGALPSLSPEGAGSQPRRKQAAGGPGPLPGADACQARRVMLSDASLRRKTCGVRKVGSRGKSVFVEESAESVAALDEGRRRVHDLQLRGRRIGRLEVE